MTSPVSLTYLGGFNRNKKLNFTAAKVSLGTDSACDVRFDPTWDKAVSARHLTLERRGNDWWVIDASKEGTFVGGQKVSSETIEPGTVLELGRGGARVQVDFVPDAKSAPGAAAEATRSFTLPPVIPAQASLPSAASPAPSSSTSGAKSKVPAWTIALIAVVVLAGALGAYLKFRPSDAANNSSAEHALAEAAHNFSDAVALVVLVHPKIGNGRPTPVATGWAVAPRIFATNSHVTKLVLDVLDHGGAAYLVINRHPDIKLKIVKSVVHPRYEKPELNFEGKQVAVPAYDVGLLYTDENAPKVFKLASRQELERVDSGYRIGYLGFPMEGMAGNGVEIRSPVATMQSGIVTSITDYWLAQGSFEKRLLVQHNLGATGGASGSPIFNSRGEIIAILSAGNIIGAVSFETGEVARAPSGVMVNFAQRVDLLKDIWPDYPKD